MSNSYEKNSTQCGLHRLTKDVEEAKQLYRETDGIVPEIRPGARIPQLYCLRMYDAQCRSSAGIRSWKAHRKTQYR